MSFVQTLKELSIFLRYYLNHKKCFAFEINRDYYLKGTECELYIRSIKIFTNHLTGHDYRSDPKLIRTNIESARLLSYGIF